MKLAKDVLKHRAAAVTGHLTVVGLMCEHSEAGGVVTAVVCASWTPAKLRRGEEVLCAAWNCTSCTCHTSPCGGSFRGRYSGGLVGQRGISSPYAHMSEEDRALAP